MKQLIKSALHTIGYDVRRVMPAQNRFTIADIVYEVDPCSIGQEPQGEMTGRAAAQFIRDGGRRDLKILDICCGVGIIGLTIFSELRRESIIKQVAFADINIFNLNSLLRTLKINNLDHLLGDQIVYWLSDSLKNIPQDQKFDIIVSNPPHFFSEDHTTNELVPRRLAIYDADWSLHKSFYSSCHNYLNEHGEIWFLENGDAVTEKDFLPFIKANPSLEYVKSFPEPVDPTYFWMISRKV